MAVKEKVLASMKTSYAKFGFKKTELESLADVVSKTLTEESTDEEISNAVSGAMSYAEIMQKLGNRYATEVEEKYKGWIDPKTITKPEPSTEPKGLTMEEVQQMMSEKLNEALAPYKEREHAQQMRALINNHERMKTVPEVFRNNYTLEKEDDLDAVLTRIESDYTAMKQAMVQSGQFVEAPQNGGGGGDETDDLIERMHRVLASDK